MSITLKILVPAVPPHNADAYAFADALAATSADSAPALRLQQFHDALIARYPCWSSGAYSGGAVPVLADAATAGNAGVMQQGRAACPWMETPLINCFRGDMGKIGIDTQDQAVVPFVLRRAGAFALTVIDEAAGKVYRPATFSVALSGIQKNVNIPAMVNKLMPLLKATREEVLAAIDTPHVLLKCRLDYVTAKRFAATMDLIGCDCTIEKEVLVPVGGSLSGDGASKTIEPPTALKPGAGGRKASRMAARKAAATASAAQAMVSAKAPEQPAGRVASDPVQPNPMSRFEIDDPTSKTRRGLSLAPSWLARVFGKANAPR